MLNEDVIIRWHATDLESGAARTLRTEPLANVYYIAEFAHNPDRFAMAEQALTEFVLATL